MRTLQPRERQLVAIGILIVALIVAWFGLIDPVLGGFIARAEERSQLMETYARNERVLAGISVWRAEADRQKMTESQYAIVAPTKVLATENLKQRLTKLASSVGGSVQTMAELPAEAPDGWVRVRADMQLTMSQLYKSLSRLENEAPYVVVGYVSVVADRAVQTGHLATMDVRIEVSAPVRTNQPS
ncbi:MAG TPA: type II secretion system protein GspM [Rhizomicrobium sp.]|jgi:type II secretory pathway component PulM|nr:type II secretion system protein GspM [Rhizomicrobium sp.]